MILFQRVVRYKQPMATTHIVFNFLWMALTIEFSMALQICFWRMFSRRLNFTRHWFLMSQFEVRKDVNKTIADVVAWSMDYAASGRYPTRGFYNEEFGDGTYRKSVGGRLIAAGHKFP